MALHLAKGVLYVAEMDVDTGFEKDVYIDLGECDAASFDMSVQRIEKRTNRDCTAALVASVRGQLNSNLKITFAEPTAANLKRFLQATQTATAATAITGETVYGPAALSSLAAGDFLTVRHPIGTWTSLKDSAGSPATFVLNTDYEVYDAKHGILRMLQGITGTAPLKAAYTPIANTSNALLAGTEKHYAVRYAGINCVTDARETWEFFKVLLTPPETMELLGNDNFSAYQTTNPVLYTAQRAAIGLFGGYARQVSVA